MDLQRVLMADIPNSTLFYRAEGTLHQLVSLIVSYYSAGCCNSSSSFSFSHPIASFNGTRFRRSPDSPEFMHPPIPIRLSTMQNLV